MATYKCHHFWTIAEVEANLPKILHLVETEGPQGIDAEKSFVITLVEASDKLKPSRKPLGQWLVENMPRGTNLKFQAVVTPVPRYLSSSPPKNERLSPRHQRRLGNDQARAGLTGYRLSDRLKRLCGCL